MKESQNKQIARYLIGGAKLTSLDALALFGCLRLSARIHDLRDDGMQIESKPFVTRNGKTVAQYYIKGNE